MDFKEEYRLYGSFSGTDLDHNNQIDLAELTDLVIGDRFGARHYMDCASAPYDHTCSLTSFTYVLGGTLNFTARQRDMVDYGGGEYEARTKVFVAGAYIERWWQLPGFFWLGYENFTPQTTFMITTVPEPHAYAGLGAGLLLLAALARRNKKCRPACTGRHLEA